MQITDLKCKSPLCKTTFTPEDYRQVYCSRKCQQGWNNYKAKRLRDQLKKTNKVILKNREILARILGEQKERIVSRDFLLGAEFNFTCLTNSYRDNGMMINCVYDYGMTRISDNQYKIFRYGRTS